LYWKARFKEQPVDDFCSTILTNTGDKDIGKVIYCRWNSIGYYHAKSHFQATETNHK